MSPADIAAQSEKLASLIGVDDAASIPIAAKLVAELRTQRPDSHELVEALTTYGMQLHVTGDWKQARTVLEEALLLPAASADGELLIELKFQLGALYTELREVDKAVGILRSAVELATAAYGPDADETTRVKESLASAFDFAKEYPLAEPVFREVLAAYEKGGEPTRIGRAATNLAINLEFQDRDPEALKLFVRAVKELSAAKHISSFERGSLAEATSGIGRVQQRQGNLKEAIASYRKALAIRMESLGADHPLVALEYHNLATALRDAKRLPEAREMCAKARAIREVTLPADHPYRRDTEAMCNDLAAAK
jgi:tetratricopeptide (TPR) repeat protein